MACPSLLSCMCMTSNTPIAFLSKTLHSDGLLGNRTLHSARDAPIGGRTNLQDACAPTGTGRSVAVSEREQTATLGARARLLTERSASTAQHRAGRGVRLTPLRRGEGRGALDSRVTLRCMLLN